MFFFFKQKTAYEMRISDWSSDVCSSDLVAKKVEAVAGALSERAQQTGRDAVTVAGATAQTLAGLQDLGDRGHALAATMTKIVDDGSRARAVRGEAHGKIRQASERATALKAASQSIEQMLALIIDMASRTNMLALNAGIEDRKSTRLNSSH